MSRHRFIILTFVLALAVASGAMVGTILGPLGSASAEELKLAPAPTPGAAVVVPSFADLAERSSSSVVLITKEVFRDAPAATGQGGPDLEEIPPMFRRFFQGPFNDQGNPDEGLRLPPETSSGSGFFITGDGYVLTNKHVIEGAERLTVETQDGKDYDAEIVGQDPYYDVALLKVKGEGPFPALPLGSSADLRPGEWVLAIGNPISFRDSVTVGVVSGKGRRLEFGPDQLSNYIQTDAAINFGNSGGPLINARGEAIGINTAIVRRRQVAPMQAEVIQGINFALPIDVVKPHLDQLATEGTVRRGYLGVTVQPVTQEMAEYFELPEARGAFVSGVGDDTPASRAGVQADDVILSVDGVELSDSSDLVSIVSNRRPGESVELEVWRGGGRKALTVELTERRIGLAADAPVERVPEESGEVSALGFTVSPMPQNMREALVDRGIEGVVITDVDPRSDAYRKGLRRRGILLELNGLATPTLETFREAKEKVEPGSVVRVRVGDTDGNEVALFFSAPENGS